MATTFEKISSNKVKLGFEVAPEEFESALVKAYHKNAKHFNIPGFRKGKAPMKVIENYYGSSVFFEEAFDIMFPGVYQEAISEYNLDVVDRPELTESDIKRGEKVNFTVEVFVRPDVKLGEYKGLGLEKEVAEVTDDDVNAEIERARERASRYIEISDRPAALDDQVNIDYAGFDGDEQFDGGTAKGHDLVLGSGTFIPGFEEQLVGANVGDEVEVNVTFPEDYHAPELAGKPVVFKVKVNSICQKDIPALDDDFVTEVSENANNVEEYKAEIRAKLEKNAEDRAETAFENAVIEKVNENTEIDVPQAMIEDQIDNMVRDMEMQVLYRGMKMDDYLKYTGVTREKLREMYRNQASVRVHTQLTLEAVRKAENIEATEEEIDAEMQKYADQNQKTLEEFKAMLSDDDKKYFSEIAAMQKTVKFLKENAK